MKKTLALFLCVIMLFLTCACKQKEKGVANIEMDDDIVYDVESSQISRSDSAEIAGEETTVVENSSETENTTSEEKNNTISNSKSKTTVKPKEKASEKAADSNAGRDFETSQISRSDNPEIEDTETTVAENSSKAETTKTKESTNTNSKSNAASNSNSSEELSIDESAIFTDTRTIVACWGDSVTEGMGMPGSSYPNRLKEYLGDDYNVLNAGDGGENNRAISARQGALKVYLKNKIKFNKNADSVYLGDEREAILVTKDNKPINLTNALGNQISINNVTINGKKYKLRFEKFVWEPRSFAMYMDRFENTYETVEIPANSEVIFNNTDITKKGGIDIYLMGINGGYDNSNEYISQIKAMISYHGSDKYLVVVPYWTTGYDELFKKNFGDHAVNFREAAIKDGLAFENLSPTDTDKTSIANRLVPASLHYENNANDVHLNQYGYHFLAYTLYQQGIKLGYFK